MRIAGVSGMLGGPTWTIGIDKKEMKKPKDALVEDFTDVPQVLWLPCA